MQQTALADELAAAANLNNTVPLIPSTGQRLCSEKGMYSMRTSTKLVLTTLAATIMLASVLASASAQRLSISNRNIRAVWTNFQFVESEGGGPAIECAFTMEGTFHSNTIVKRERALLGYITRGIFRHPCSGGELWVHNGSEVILGRVSTTHLPWHISYENFRGTLPAITSIGLLLTGILITLRYEIIGIACLAGYGGPTSNLRGEAIRNTTTSTLRIQAEPLSSIPRLEGGFPCPAALRFNGVSSEVTLLGTTTPVTVRLI